MLAKLCSVKTFKHSQNKGDFAMKTKTHSLYGFYLIGVFGFNAKYALVWPCLQVLTLQLYREKKPKTQKCVSGVKSEKSKNFKMFFERKSKVGENKVALDF